MRRDGDPYLGRWGEALAARWLFGQGYTILDHHCWYREGELDLLALKGDLLAVVEVKLRTGDFTAGSEAVTARKQDRIRRAIGRYLMDHPELGNCIIRFDVCQIDAPAGTDTEGPTITYFENCFY